MADGSGGEELQAILEGAERAALSQGAPEVLPEHLLLSLAEARPAPVKALLDRHKVTRAALEAALPKAHPPEAHPPGTAAAPGAQGSAATHGSLASHGNGKGPLAPAPEMAALLSRAAHYARAAKRPGAGPLDLLRALLDDAALPVTEVLAGRFGVTHAAIEKSLGGAAKVPETGPVPAAGLPGLAAAAGVHEAAPGGGGLSAEVRSLDVRVRMLEARLRGSERRLSRRIALVYLLVLMLAAAVVYIFATAPLPRPF